MDPNDGQTDLFWRDEFGVPVKSKCGLGKTWWLGCKLLFY